MINTAEALRDDVTVDEWVAALESGAYVHSAGSLRNEDDPERTGHCCLGVLLDIAGAEWEDHESRYHAGEMTCRQIGDASSIPSRYRHLLGPEVCGVLNRLLVDSEHSDGHNSLVATNDSSEDGYRPVIKRLRQLQEEVA